MSFPIPTRIRLPRGSAHPNRLKESAGPSPVLQPPAPPLSLVGRTCVVTGASSGIGKAAAIGLARLGAEVVLVCRSWERGESAVVEVTRAAAVRPNLLVADLSSMAAVRRLAAEILQRHPRLHVLVNNAGLILAKRSVTAEGMETTLAVNHLAPFLLTNLLLERLEVSAPSRVVTVSSGAHRTGRIHFDDLGLSKGYSGLGAYAQSKLANILFTRELARRLEGSGVTAACMHPGFVATRLGRGTFPLFSVPIRLFRPFIRTPERGADTVVHLAASPAVEKASGGYYHDRRLAAPTSRATDPEAARRLWEVSARLVRLTANPSRGTPPS